MPHRRPIAVRADGKPGPAEMGLLFCKEKPNAFSQFGGISRPALPHNQYLPAELPQFPHMLPPALDISAAFCFPVVRVRLRGHTATSAPVHMPEAAMHKNDFPVSGKDYVWYAREIPAVQTKSVPHRMHHAPDRQLRLRILRADPRHTAGSLCWREIIRKASLASHSAR